MQGKPNCALGHIRVRAQGGFGPQSDVDVLVRFKEGASVTLFDMNRMAAELENMFGREVDLVSQRGVERSTSQLRRKAILDSAEPLYEF